MVGHFGASLVLPSCHGSMPPKKIPPRHSDTMDLNFNDKNKTWPKFEEPSVYFSSIYLVLLFWRTFYWSVFFKKNCFYLCFTISLLYLWSWISEWIFVVQRVIFYLRKGQKYLKSTSICFLCGSCGSLAI